MQPNGSTILIVDDNPINCKVLMSSLEVFPEYKILLAHTGTKAVSIAQRARPDLILLDINLPEMNGFEVCRTLKSDPETRETPIIFLSALDDVESKVKGFELGGVDYVTKPFYKDEVIKRVETQLKLQQLTRMLQAQMADLEEKNEELRSMGEQLQQAHEHTTDSIRYAKRIQTALMPGLEVLREHLPEVFVYYVPRDIVSGDFYYYARLGARLCLAAVDCTGHGVPGALMSVIGYTQLNTIITEGGKSESQEVLFELDARVRNILNQSSDRVEEQDGMDIALCFYDPAERKLDFAGANLPLYVVRGAEIFELKGDKYPIGGTQFEDKQYMGNVVPLEPGDMVYLFSDGYADQFGGPDGRKLSRRRFKEILTEIADKVPHLQQLALEQRLLEWREGYEQIDDVMVIGFRVH